MIFDPMGLLAPVFVKVFMQKIHIKVKEWDGDLDEELNKDWFEWIILSDESN